MKESPSWASLFERAEAFETDLEAVRAAVEAIRETAEGGDG
jgi:hypothetical protein